MEPCWTPGENLRIFFNLNITGFLLGKRVWTLTLLSPWHKTKMEKIKDHHVSSSAAFWVIREERTAWKYRNREGMSEAVMKEGKKTTDRQTEKKGKIREGERQRTGMRRHSLICLAAATDSSSGGTVWASVCHTLWCVKSESVFKNWFPVGDLC